MSDHEETHQGFDAFNYARQLYAWKRFVECGLEKMMIYVEVFDFDVDDDDGRVDC